MLGANTFRRADICGVAGKYRGSDITRLHSALPTVAVLSRPQRWS
jgi:hypothetical protein